MTPNIKLQHERVDDIPLLLGLMKQLHLPEVLEAGLGSHHLHRGLSNGLLACGWLAFILSASNHCKVSVQDWAVAHQHTLETLLGQPLRPVEFSDDRLSIILRRFHDADWSALESSLWQATCQVYEIPIDCVRLDSTTSYGYHTVNEDGLMQFGHSKDHRPDLPQLKLMAAAAQPSGHLLGTDLHPGNAADDPLYLPLIRRVRAQLDGSGRLYVGDCKMAAFGIRADIAAHQDFYLMPLPQTGETQKQFANWVDAVVNGTQMPTMVYASDDSGESRLVGAGYEFERVLQAEVEGKTVEWTERVQMMRSMSLAARQDAGLEERLTRATEEIKRLTPAPGKGKRQYTTETELREAIKQIEQKHRVSDLLSVKVKGEQTEKKQYESKGRPAVGSPFRMITETRYQVEEVSREEEKITEAKNRNGWRVQVTNLPKTRADLEKCVEIYNGGWSLERDFHVLKSSPIGIQPLFVREEEQIVGLVRLLTIALRLLTLIEMTVRSKLKEEGSDMGGLYEGQQNRRTARPTATRMLKAIVRMGITSTLVTIGEDSSRHLTTLPPILIRILESLGLSEDIYSQLASNASCTNSE